MDAQTLVSLHAPNRITETFDEIFQKLIVIERLNHGIELLDTSRLGVSLDVVE